MQAEQVALHGAAVRAAALDKANQPVRPVGDVAITNQRAEQCRALPLVMSVDLRDRSTEASADRVLERLDELALALQVLDFPEMQANLDQLDERIHCPMMPVATALRIRCPATYSRVFST